MVKALTQAPDERGRRRTRWLVCRNCFDDQTEILTDRGFVFFKDLLDTDKVAQLRDGFMEFVEPIGKYRSPYVGEMLGFEAEGADFLVTPDHWMWASTAHTRKKVFSEFRHIRAKDIWGKGDIRFQRDAKWVGDAQGKSVEFFRLLGLWFAEGHAFVKRSADGYLRHRAVITQTDNGEMAAVRKIIAEGGVTFLENARTGGGGSNFVMQVTEETKPLILDLAAAGNQTVRRVPDYVKQAPAEHARAFIEGFLVGDGHKRGNSQFGYTASKQLADDLQELALRAGMVANISYRERHNARIVIDGNLQRVVPRSDEYTITFLTERKASPRTFWQNRSTRKRGWYKQTYSGEVFCVEVPTHVVCVRRKGKTLWCGQTIPELESTTLPSWKQHFHTDFGAWRNVSPITHQWRFKIGDGTEIEADILFLGLDGPDAANKIRGMELTGAWLNEAKDIPRGVLDMCTGRVGRYPPKKWGGPTWFGIIADTNMPDDDHWLYDLAEVQKPAGWGFHRQPGGVIKLAGKWQVNENAENIANLPPNYYQNQLAGKSEEWIKVYLAAEYGYVADGRPVFPEYSDIVHVGDLEYNDLLPLYIGMDFGLTPAIVIGQIDSFGRKLIIDELVTYNCGIVQFADRLRSFLAARYPNADIAGFWGDPAAAKRTQTDKQTLFQIMKAGGFDVRPAPGNNEYVVRQGAVSAPLTRLVEGRPGLLIDRKCTKLRAGMAGKYCYRRIQVRSDTFADRPDKNEWSHVAESLQYLCLGWGEGRDLVQAKGRPGLKQVKVITGTKRSHREVQRTYR